MSPTLSTGAIRPNTQKQTHHPNNLIPTDKRTDALVCGLLVCVVCVVWSVVVGVVGCLSGLCLACLVCLWCGGGVCLSVCCLCIVAPWYLRIVYPAYRDGWLAWRFPWSLPYRGVSGESAFWLAWLASASRLSFLIERGRGVWRLGPISASRRGGWLLFRRLCCLWRFPGRWWLWIGLEREGSGSPACLATVCPVPASSDWPRRHRRTRPAHWMRAWVVRVGRHPSSVWA